MYNVYNIYYMYIVFMICLVCLIISECMNSWRISLSNAVHVIENYIGYFKEFQWNPSNMI